MRSKNKLGAKKIYVPKSYSQNEPAIKMHDASSELIEQLNILVTRVVEIFNSHKITLDYFLAQWGAPMEVWLNCIGTFTACLHQIEIMGPLIIYEK